MTISINMELGMITETSAVGAAWKAGLRAGKALTLNSSLFTATLHEDASEECLS
jgi:hypothetical protein